MNVYKVTGYVTWLQETTCEFCGQDYQEEKEQGIEVLVESVDEQTAAISALAQVNADDGMTGCTWGTKGNNYKHRKPTVELMREISEAEQMTRLGALRLFQ